MATTAAAEALWRWTAAARTAEMAAMAMAMAAAVLRQHNTHAVSTCVHTCAGRLATCGGQGGREGERACNESSLTSCSGRGERGIEPRIGRADGHPAPSLSFSICNAAPRLLALRLPGIAHLRKRHNGSISSECHRMRCWIRKLQVVLGQMSRFAAKTTVQKRLQKSARIARGAHALRARGWHLALCARELEESRTAKRWTVRV